MFNINFWVSNTDVTSLKEEVEHRLLDSGFSILSMTEHFFKPFGYTGLWLLAESHLAIHTFPEENRTYVELSSCIEDKYVNFISKPFLGLILEKEHNNGQ